MTLPDPKIYDLKIGRFLLLNSRETISKNLISTGDFEPLPRKILAGLFPEGDAVVVDVGANLGTFAIPVASTNPSGHVYAFEPQRVIFYQLCGNIILNRLSNVRAYNSAVGLSTGRVSMPVVDIGSANNLGAVSLVEDIRRKNLEKKKYVVSGYDYVPVTSLDGFFIDREKKIDFIKIDVEGMEEGVLSGGQGILSCDNPVVFFESWSSDRGARDRLFKIFPSSEYSFFDLGEDVLAFPKKKIRSGREVRSRASGLEVVW